LLSFEPRVSLQFLPRSLRGSARAIFARIHVWFPGYVSNFDGNENYATLDYLAATALDTLASSPD